MQPHNITLKNLPLYLTPEERSQIFLDFYLSCVSKRSVLVY